MAITVELTTAIAVLLAAGFSAVGVSVWGFACPHSQRAGHARLSLGESLSCFQVLKGMALACGSLSLALRTPKTSGVRGYGPRLRVPVSCFEDAKTLRRSRVWPSLSGAVSYFEDAKNLRRRRYGSRLADPLRRGCFVGARTLRRPRSGSRLAAPFFVSRTATI